MKKGNGLFVVLLILCVASETLDHSPEPILSVIASLWQILFFLLGVWKGLELFNNWKGNGTPRN